MAEVKLKLKPRHARLFDTHAKGEPRQRIAHLYQTVRMRPAIFSKYVKDMDNIKPACAVIFRSDIGQTVESLLGRLSPAELQTLGCTIDAIDYARRAEIAIYKRDPPSFSLLAEHPEGGLIIGKHVTQEEKDQIMSRLWSILAMLMVDDDNLVDEEQTPWDETCLSVTLYSWVKHLLGVTACMSEATCRCADVARTYEVPASAFRAAWVYVDNRCHRWQPSDRYTTIRVSRLAPEVRMADIFSDTGTPEKLPSMASIIHLPIPPYHSIRLKPSGRPRIKRSISTRRSKKLSTVMPNDPLEQVAEIPIHPPFLANYMEMTAGEPSTSGGISYDGIFKLVSRSIYLKQGIHSKWKSITLRENEWIIVGWALIYRRQLGLCIRDICGVIPSPTESFKPWHIGRLLDVLMFIQDRKQGPSSTRKHIHGYYPNFRTLVLSSKHSISKGSAKPTMEDGSNRRWVLLRALWDLLGRLLVWEDANVKPIGGESDLLSTTQINDSIDPTLVIDWKGPAFPLAITSWVKHSISFSTCYISVYDANCGCRNTCKLYNVPYHEFLAAFKVLDSICKREGWTIGSLTYMKESDSKITGARGVVGNSKDGKTSSSSVLASQTPSTITGDAGNRPPRVESTPNQGSLSRGRSRMREYKSSISARSLQRKSRANKRPAPALSPGPTLLQTHEKAIEPPSTSPKNSHQSVPSAGLQDKSASTNLSYRRRVSFKTPNLVESSVSQEDWCDNSQDSDSESDSDQDFKPEQVFHNSRTDRSISRPRKAQLNVHANVRIKKSTRVTAPHKLVDWSSESDGAMPSVPWKGNKRRRVSSPTPSPSDREVKKLQRQHAGPSRMNEYGVNMVTTSPYGYPPQTPMAMATSPDPYFDSPKGHIPYSMDLIGFGDPSVRAPRHPEVGVSTSHRLVNDNRSLFMSPGDAERPEGRTTYGSKASGRVSKPANGQEESHDGKSGTNLDPRDGNRGTVYRVTHAIGRTSATRSGTLENKKRKYHQGDRLARDFGLPEENQPELKRFKREHPVMGSSGHQQIQQSTTPPSLSEISLVIYDLNPDHRRLSLDEERSRLLNACRLFGIPIALDVQTVPENGGIGVCEPLSAEVLEKLDNKRISYLRDHFGIVLSLKLAPLPHDPIIPPPRASNRVLYPAEPQTNSSGGEVDVHSEPEERETLSFYDQSESCMTLAEEADRLVGLIGEACKMDLKEMDWNIEMVRGHVAVVLRDKDAIRRACSMLAPTFVRKEISRRNVTVLRGEELWVVPRVMSQSLVSQRLHQSSNISISARYQRNLALFNKTVAARGWTSAAVQGFHW